MGEIQVIKLLCSYEEIYVNILLPAYNIRSDCTSKLGSQTTKIAKDSTLIKIHDLLEDVDFRIHGLDRYKLYPTENIYNFLQLDTSTGKIDVVQWSLDDGKEGSVTLNDEDLSLDTGCGTFELYPTKNMYQFILLDKVTGRKWHVQWGFEASKRWIKRIY